MSAWTHEVRELELADGADAPRTLQVHLGGWEAADGPVLLVHHGTPGWGHPTRVVLDACAPRGVRVVGLTRPGYSRSTPLPGRDVAAVVPDVRRVMKTLGVNRFLVAGISGGGPHALATAALLPDHVAAAASISGAGPSDAPDLDFLAGMGQDNLDEFGAARESEAALRAYMEADVPEMVGVTAEQLAASLKASLPPVDAEQVTGVLAEDLLEQFERGVERGVEGWFEDDLALLSPWGFDMSALAAVPVAVWHGGLDLFAPPSHGAWLAAHVPHATARLLPDEGHLSMLTRRIGDILDELLTHW